MPMTLLQIPAPPPGAIENFLVTLAAIASMVVLGKKLLPRKTVEFATRAELLMVVSRAACLEQKLDRLDGKIERLGNSLHTHLGQLEADLARVDERTKNETSKSQPVPR